MTRLMWGSVLRWLDFHHSVFKGRLLYLSSSSQKDQERKAIYSCPYCCGLTVLSTPITISLLLTWPKLVQSQSSPEVCWSLCKMLPVTTCPDPILPPKPSRCHFCGASSDPHPHLFLPSFSLSSIELIPPCVIIRCVLVFPSLSF